MTRHLSLAVAALLAAFVAPPAAMSQTGQPATQQAEQNGSQESRPQISDEKLDMAAAAAEKVVALKQKYAQRFASADDTNRREIVNEAQNELKKAVTDQGLSVEEYEGIMQIAQNDTSVRDKLLDRLKVDGENEEL